MSVWVNFSRVGMLAETMIGERSVVAIDAFDRSGAAPIRRVHQEDMCYALGLPPGKKYQSDGRPGIVSLITRAESPTVSRDDVDQFLQAQAFAWATAATDAHAKNYGFLMSGNSMTLAPLYDLYSAAPLPDRGTSILAAGQDVNSYGGLGYECGG